MHLVDLSHVIEHGTVTYPGLPTPEIGEHLSYEVSRERYEDAEFTIGRITMVSNTGTYLDTPAHRFRDGSDLSGLSLTRCADLPAVVVDADGSIGPDVLDGLAVTGVAVLLRTGWDRHWGTEKYGDTSHPHLTADAATLLADNGASLIGIDSINLDGTATGHRPAHTILLRAGISVVEHLTNLSALPSTGARFTAVPPLIRGLATFPVRAFATLPDTARQRV